MAYCTAHLAAEYAVASGDPAAIGPAFAAIVEAAPAELAEAVAYVTENPPADDGPPSVEFNAAYNAVSAGTTFLVKMRPPNDDAVIITALTKPK